MRRWAILWLAKNEQTDKLYFGTQTKEQTDERNMRPKEGEGLASDLGCSKSGFRSNFSQIKAAQIKVTRVKFHLVTCTLKKKSKYKWKFKFPNLD